MALEAEEMELPDFLENSSEDEIHEKMLGNLPVSFSVLVYFSPREPVRTLPALQPPWK